MVDLIEVAIIMEDPIEEMKKEVTTSMKHLIEDMDKEREPNTSIKDIASTGTEVVVTLDVNVDSYTRNLRIVSTKLDVTEKMFVDFSMLICSEEMMAIF